MSSYFNHRCLRFERFVGQHENFSSQFRFQSRVTIVASEEAVFPDEKIGIVARKLLPTDIPGACHAFVDQEKIRAGDGFMVELRFAVGDCEFFQGTGKSLQRIKNGILAEVAERQLDMVGMVKSIVGDCSTLESCDDLIAGY
jgi:hypothetical protein